MVGLSARDNLRAMSQEDVKNLRAFCEAWGRISDVRRFDGLDMSLLDRDVTYEDTTLPDHAGEAYHGHEGVARAIERWAEPYETLAIELERVAGAGSRLVSVHRVRAKARHTGIDFEAPVAYLWTFRDGKVVHFRSFADPEEAFQAAGLPLDV
jgi:ketosteroid isomerase-like protein